MARGASANRYALGLFQLAKQQGPLEQWVGDLGLVSEVLQTEEFHLFLGHPKVPNDRKVQAIGAAMQGVDPMVRNLVALLATRGLIELFHEVRMAYGRLLDEDLGRQPVEVISAVPLDQNELDRISKLASDLTQKQVVLSSRVDESILGGLVIEIGDRVLNGSTVSRLEGLRNVLRRAA